MKHLGDISNADEIRTYKVYKHVFPDGTTYVGVTGGTIQYRKDCGYQHNEAMKDAVSRFGWKNIRTEILEDNLLKDEAFEKEQKYINIEKDKNPDKNINISHGGKSTFKGLKHTEEYRKHMSELCKGRHYSPETIQKMCQSHAEERKPVVMCNEDNNPICVYESLGAAAIDICGYKSNISRACYSGKKYKGMYWRFMGGGDLR